MKLNKKLVLIVLLFAALIQLIIITYNNVTGYISIPDTGNFLIRLIIGTTFTFLFGLLAVFIDLLIINKLDKIFQLPEKVFSRIPFEVLAGVFAGVMIGTSVTLTAHIMMPYKDGLMRNIINNSLITAVINIILIVGIEALVWFKRSQESIIRAERLESENAQIKFETLKSQLNPHFLFNSLNVLSSLIKKDSDKAQNFVDQFSSVYRYTLEVIEKPVVELREELDFAKSFMFLQKTRFDNTVTLELNVDASKLNYFVPSLAVQTLFENAFKHNKASTESPLIIKVFVREDFLFVVNNLQLKIRGVESKGVGLSNLKKRYELLGANIPQFSVTEKEYIAKIPLIKPD